jgi:gamma-glutamyltranspeptidase
VYSADGVVAAPHYLASLAGIDVLRDGGSAVDAAIAANLVLGVVWPHMCGPGGDLLAQVWSAADEELFGLNASGRAGHGMSVEAYRARGLETMPQRGALAVTVPGAVDGWCTLHQRFGQLDMPRLARDAVHYARDGFRLTPFTAGAIRANATLLEELGGGAEVFLGGDCPPSAGARSESASSLTCGRSAAACKRRTSRRSVRSGSSRSASSTAASRCTSYRRTARASPCSRCSTCSTTSTSGRGVRARRN